MTAQHIRALLPHRHPVQLVDRVLEHVPGVRLTALKAVSGNEPCFAHAPEDSDLHYPAALLMESWAQAAGLLIVSGKQPDTGCLPLLGGMSAVTFSRLVYPGDTVTHEVTVVRAIDSAVLCSGRSTVHDDPVMSIGQAVLTVRSTLPSGPERDEDPR